MWTAENWISENVKAELLPTFRWTVEEAQLLLAAPVGEMWQRGDLGQCVYMLLVADPACDELLDRVVMTTGDDEVRWQAALLRVARADGNGLQTFNALAAATPSLRGADMFSELLNTLREHGSVSLW